MRVGIASVQVPFISGGAEILARGLHRELVARGHLSDIITMPFKWYPPDAILDHCRIAELLDLTEINGEPIDRLITLKFPAYFTQHPNKVAWLLHQHRQAYDLFGTEFGDLHHDDRGVSVAAEIRHLDNARLPEHRRIFTISEAVSRRLQKYNGIASDVLYHPPEDHHLLRSESYEDYILVPGRLDPIKRQKIIVEALRYVPDPIRLVVIGDSTTAYGRETQDLVEYLGLGDRVSFLGVVSQDEKLELYAHALAIYNGAYDEDYGYITLEGFFASKAVIAHTDAGGPLEFIVDDVNGWVTPPDPGAVASVLRSLASDPSLASRLGEAGRATVVAKNMDWDHVIGELLA